MDIPFIGGRTRSLAGSADKETGTMWTTPWEWKTNDGVYFNNKGEAWLYRCLDLFPIDNEDTEARLSAARQLSGILSDLGRLTPDNKTGISQLDTHREVHIESITWDLPLVSPKGNTSELIEYQQQAFSSISVPKRMLAVGIRLEDSLLDKLSKTKADAERSGDSLWKQIFKQFETMHAQSTGGDVPSLHKFAKDKRAVESIMNRYRAHIPTLEESAQLEAWFNDGRTPDVVMDVFNEYIEVESGAYPKRLEFSAVANFERKDFTAPNDQWIFEALSIGMDSPCLVSIRGKLERPSATRARGRKAMRRRQGNLEEQQESGDLSKGELESDIARGEALDQYLATETNSILANCSIIFVREVTPSTETYMDVLEERYGIRVKPLPKRQMHALDEVQPGSIARVNPFLQDVTLPMIVYSGLQAFADLGDDRGVYAGLVSPEDSPLYIDPAESSARNLPPVFCVFGEPGSGKTFFAQSFATQVVLLRMPVIFINPKGGDSLYGMVNYVNEYCEGATASRISMQEAEQQPGAFDPFRFADPARAQRLAMDHLESAFAKYFDDAPAAVRLKVSEGLRIGSEHGAGSVTEALQHITDDDLREEFTELVAMQARSNPLFALGVALEPLGKITMASHLTLIDFDRDIGLPDFKKAYSEYTPAETIAVAAVGLIMDAALEILLTNRGGVIILDEAWTFLQQPSSMKFLNRLAREGRSLNIIPVFLTQRIADAVSKDMESYISRVLVLQMKDPKEMEEAFRICGLRLTPERRKWLIDASQSNSGGIPQGMFRDLQGRHAVVTLGPTPAAAVDAWTTNPIEALKRERALEEKARAEAALVADYRRAEGDEATLLDAANEAAARNARTGEDFATVSESLNWQADEQYEVDFEALENGKGVTDEDNEIEMDDTVYDSR